MSVVYFAATDSDVVKIGWSADLRRRLGNLTSSNHQALRVLAIVPGGAELEALFHERFSEDRIHGEWFRLSPSIRALVESINAGHYQAPAGYMHDAKVKPASRKDLSPDSLLHEASRHLQDLAAPFRSGEPVKEKIGRAARRSGLSYWRAFDIWYRKARTLQAAELEGIRLARAARAAATSAGLRSIADDADALAEQMSRLGSPAVQAEAETLRTLAGRSRRLADGE